MTANIDMKKLDCFLTIKADCFAPNSPRQSQVKTCENDCVYFKECDHYTWEICMLYSGDCEACVGSPLPECCFIDWKEIIDWMIQKIEEVMGEA